MDMQEGHSMQGFSVADRRMGGVFSVRTRVRRDSKWVYALQKCLLAVVRIVPGSLGSSKKVSTHQISQM